MTDLMMFNVLNKHRNCVCVCVIIPTLKPLPVEIVVEFNGIFANVL